MHVLGRNAEKEADGTASYQIAIHLINGLNIQSDGSVHKTEKYDVTELWTGKNIYTGVAARDLVGQHVKVWRKKKNEQREMADKDVGQTWRCSWDLLEDKVIHNPENEDILSLAILEHMQTPQFLENIIEHYPDLTGILFPGLNYKDGDFKDYFYNRTLDSRKA